MRLNRPMIFASLAAMLVGVTVVAAAERPSVHVLAVSLPDGSVEHIRYTGDIVPHILIGNGAVPAMPSPATVLDTAFDPASPFAEFDRIAAEMDRQMFAMMQQATTVPPSSAGVTTLTPAALTPARAGATSYTLISTSNGNATCSRSVQMTSTGDGKAPQVVSKVSGDCGDSARATPAVAPAKPAPDSI